MIHKKTKLLSIVTLCALTACGTGSKRDAPQSPLANIGDRSISQEQFDTFLKVKRIPSDNPERVNRILDEYLHREALADAIASKGAIDEEAIEVETREYNKQLLLSRYFDQYLKEAVSDQAIENYYATHADEYQEEKVKVALAKAQEAYSKINAGGDFADIAKVLEGPQIIKQPFDVVKGDIRYLLKTEAKHAETQALIQSIPIRKHQTSPL